MKILLLGGNGYVGSALYAGIANCEITSMDTCLWGPDLGYSLNQDVCTLTESQVRPYDVVIMLSAHSSVGMCKHDPAGAIRNNVLNTQHVVSLLSDKQKFVYASSTGVYGKQFTPCLETDMTYQHMNWYDITKQTVDVCMQHAIQHGKQIIGLRLGTVCGVSANTRSDLFLNSMVQHACLTKQFWVNNLHVKRSVLCVRDLVHALNHMLHRNFVSGIYNLKSFDVCMHEAAETVQSKLDVKYEIRANDANSYDFTVNQDAFCNTFMWSPNCTLHDVIDELSQNDSINTWCGRPAWPQGVSYAI